MVSIQRTCKQRGRRSGRRGARRDCRGWWALTGAEGCSFPGGWELEAPFPTPLPSQSWESPRVLLQHSSASRGLAQAQGEHRSPLFPQENRGTESTTVLPLLPSWLRRSRRAQGSVQRSCSLFPLGGELPNGSPFSCPFRHPKAQSPEPTRAEEPSLAATSSGKPRSGRAVAVTSLPQMQSCNRKYSPALVTGLFAQTLGQKPLMSQSAHLVQGEGRVSGAGWWSRPSRKVPGRAKSTWGSTVHQEEPARVGDFHLWIPFFECFGQTRCCC